MAVLFHYNERSWNELKKIKSYTGIWNVEKVLYAINDFTAITKYADEIKKIMPNCIIERPTIEDIMLCNVKGGK